MSFGTTSFAVYRLFHNEDLEGDGLRVVRPSVDELGRMHGQRGLFTWLKSETYFDLEGFCDDTGRGDLLTQFIISDLAVLEGLGDLTRISDFAVVPYGHDKSARLDFRGSDARKPATEGVTLWVNYKPSPFSSHSMAF